MLESLTNALLASSVAASEDVRRALLDEAFEIAERLAAVAPESAALLCVAGVRKVMDGAPYAEVIAGYDDAFARASEQVRLLLSAQRGVPCFAVGRAGFLSRDLEAAYRQNPSDTRIAYFYSHALYASGRPLEARRLMEETFLNSQDALFCRSRFVMVPVDDKAELDRILRLAPVGMTPDENACLRQQFAVPAPGEKALARPVGPIPIVCRQVGGGPLMAVAARLGEVDYALFLTGQVLNRENPAYLPAGGGVWLFHPALAHLRADPRFLEQVKAFGLYDYWLESGTRPEPCALNIEPDFPVCAALRVDQNR